MTEACPGCNNDTSVLMKKSREDATMRSMHGEAATSAVPAPAASVILSHTGLTPGAAPQMIAPPPPIFLARCPVSH